MVPHVSKFTVRHWEVGHTDKLISDNNIALGNIRPEEAKCDCILRKAISQVGDSTNILTSGLTTFDAQSAQKYQLSQNVYGWQLHSDRRSSRFRYKRKTRKFPRGRKRIIQIVINQDWIRKKLTIALQKNSIPHSPQLDLFTSKITAYNRKK